MNVYEHEQRGTLIRVCLTVGVLACVAAAVTAFEQGDKGGVIVCSIVAAILVLVTMCFHSLTVRVTPNDIVLSFGIGMIQKSFLIEDVEDVSVVRTHWYNGWGIRWIPGGWLYNVSGFDAVEIRLRNGRRYQIGTDQPNELHTAVESARSVAK